MADTFVYDISTDIPGGFFNSAASERLNALISASIATPIAEISTDSGDLTVRFTTDISGGEKTILDGDTTGPAGGLVGRSADYLQLEADSNLLDDYEVVAVDSDGIQSVTIIGQLKRGDGVSINGFGESFTIRSSGLAPFNKSGGNLDGSGAMDFIVGPSFERGNIIFDITSTNLPARQIEVKFD